MNIIGYFAHPDYTEYPALDAIVVLEDYGDGYYSFFNVIDGHGQINKDYLDSCKKISKSEYLNMTHKFYTPVEYIREDE